MKLIHISDLHIDSRHDVIYGVSPRNNLNKAIDIIQGITNIDCVVLSGDITNDGLLQSYIIADNMLSRLGLPIFATFGNHDDPSAISNLKSTLSAIVFTEEITIKGYRLHFFNSVWKDEIKGNKSRGYINEDYVEKVISNIVGDNSRHIVVMHHPSIRQGGEWIDRKILTNNDFFIKKITSSDNIIAVLSGHYHLSATDYIGDTMFSIAPSISTSYGISLNPYEEANTPGFDILDFKPEGISKQTIMLFEGKANE